MEMSRSQTMCKIFMTMYDCIRTNNFYAYDCIRAAMRGEGGSHVCLTR